jgi:hypothetical protein
MNKSTPNNSLTYFNLPLKSIASLNRQLIEGLLAELVNNSVSKEDLSNYVIRDKRHATSWFVNYVQTEIESLDEEFVNADQGYSFSFDMEEGNKSLRFIFMLDTKGVEGSTEYFISVRKHKDYFACKE